ncbi:pyocin knob domain-containing protein [Pelagimonas varians]|uniref:Uncharacterized protein n=1 Tax=Pelagimonas varians TaxID=696760 RepID=A0A238K1D3_9RHOB|nr:pyocin knob domain-containing protein [Pelagimonas varians]PYG33129.1 hypothetical protein C8N36_102124 [Pelagimonas varians]SMX35766.1 hypothetical protein PEV8663_00586 [Pelagimonas varians]
MAWYKTGSVSVSNGSATVTGTGTAFVQNVKVGQEFRLEGGSVGYEITGVVGDTALTISPAYLGSSQSGQSYAVAPLVGFYQRAYDALEGAISQWSSMLDGPLAGRFGNGSAGQPAVSFEGETTLGWFRKAAGQLGAAVGGVQRVLLSSAALKIDVPITGSAVQSNATDTTAGCVLTTGAFGLGADAGILIGNLDTLYTSGFYYGFSASHASATPGDNPFPEYGGAFALICTNSPLGTVDGYVTQTAYNFGTNAKVKVRTISTAATGWSEWRELYNAETVLGTVSQDGGVPTGAVIERGSNANGEYVRFADGTQICTIAGLDFGSIKTNGSGTYAYPYTSDLVSVTWPAAFVGVPAASVNFTPDSVVGIAGRSITASPYQAPTATGWGSLRASKTNGDTTDFDVTGSVIATGRWF